jgi:hypothetical protein
MFKFVCVMSKANKGKWRTQKGRVGCGSWLFQGFKVVAPACVD